MLSACSAAIFQTDFANEPRALLAPLLSPHLCRQNFLLNEAYVILRAFDQPELAQQPEIIQFICHDWSKNYCPAATQCYFDAFVPGKGLVAAIYTMIVMCSKGVFLFLTVRPILDFGTAVFPWVQPLEHTNQQGN